MSIIQSIVRLARPLAIGIVLPGVIVLSGMVGWPSVVHAQEDALCQGAGGTYANGTCSSADGRTLQGQWQVISNLILFVMGAVSVTMIILAGMRYASAQGDEKQIKAAKDTILYAIVGLIVGLAAYAIVTFVVTTFYNPKHTALPPALSLVSPDLWYTYL